MGSATSDHNISFEELCDIVAPIAERYGAERVYLFGSGARGDNNSDSDFNFFLSLGHIRGLKSCELLQDLEDALGNKVDIVTDKAKLKDDFSKETLRERRLVYRA
jgi:Predicted nucleotidyltransferases